MKKTLVMLCLLFSTIAAHADINDGLIAYYPFNGNATDESGNGKHGIVYGATLIVDRLGKPTSAYAFDGVNDYIDIPNVATSHYTVSCWVKTAYGNGYGYRFIDGWTNGEIYSLELDDITNDGNPYLIACLHPWYNTTNIYEERHPAYKIVPLDTEWHFVALSYDGNIAKLYFDGVDVVEQSFSNVNYYYIAGGEQTYLSKIDFSIGRSTRNLLYFHGSIDDVRFYNRPLSSSEIHEIYSGQQTLINLSSFNVSPKSENVILKWSTEAEIDNAGFNLYRATAEDGEYIKINNALIAAAGSGTQGASYEYTDTGLRNGKTYYYKLEDIDLNGQSTMHGPVSATPHWIFGMFGIFKK